MSFCESVRGKVSLAGWMRGKSQSVFKDFSRIGTSEG